MSRIRVTNHDHGHLSGMQEPTNAPRTTPRTPQDTRTPQQAPRTPQGARTPQQTARAPQGAHPPHAPIPHPAPARALLPDPQHPHTPAITRDPERPDDTRSSRRRATAGDAVFRASRRPPRRPGRPSSRDAVRPAAVEIRGATVCVVWGWQGWHRRSWRRGDVGFVCSSRTSLDSGTPSRVILVVDKVRDEGTVAAVLDCDAFPPETYATLTRHLRNFEAIGDAERAASDPLALAVGTGSSRGSVR